MTRWKRTYWAVFVSNLLTAVGMMSFLPYFRSILEEMGVTDPKERMWWTGLLFGAAPLASTFMSPIWGSIGDRHGRKLMVLRSMLAISFFAGCMAYAQTPWMLLLLRFGQGLFSGFIPPSVTLVSIATPRELQGRVTGALQMALPAGMIIGPFVGELAIGAYGFKGLFLMVSAIAGLSAFLVACFAHEDASLRLTVERFSPASLLGNAAQDLRGLFANREVRWALGAVFAIQLGVGATSPLLEIFVEEFASDPAQRVQLTSRLFSAYAVAGLVTTPLWGRVGDRFGHAPALLAVGLICATILGLHAAAATYTLLFLCRVGIGAVAPGASVAAFGVAATETRNENRGGALGAVFSARTLSVSIGSFAGGALAAGFGLRSLFLTVAATIAVLLFALPRSRGAR